MTVNIAKDFYHRLVNRDDLQGDGKYTGKEFRLKFLSPLDDLAWWTEKDDLIVLDFEGVRTLGPSWANEVFAYYTKFDLKPDAILKRIKLNNISKVKMETILVELETGYNG